MKEEGGNVKTEDAEVSVDKEKGDEDPKEEELAESKPDVESESAGQDGDEEKENEEPVANGDVADDEEEEPSEKEELKEERLPNAVVLPPMSSMPGSFFSQSCFDRLPSTALFFSVPDSMLLGSRVSLRSNKSIKSHHSAKSHHSSKSAKSHHSSRSHHSAKSQHSHLEVSVGQCSAALS